MNEEVVTGTVIMAVIVVFIITLIGCITFANSVSASRRLDCIKEIKDKPAAEIKLLCT